MKFTYNNLSPGYVGESSENATLNSQYYSLFFKEITELQDILVFPQRIPRSGFFEEMYLHETSYYKNQINQLIETIKTKHKNALQSLTKSNSTYQSRLYINWSNILLRYGCFEHLINNFPKNYSDTYSLEIELIKESAKIELLLSQDEKPSIDELLELSERFIDHPETSDREKIMLLNQIVVNFYRYKINSNNSNVFELSKVLLQLLQNFENSNFLNTLYCSIGYRGLAMVSEFGNETQTSFLEKSEKLARSIHGQTEIEKIVAKENLYTLLQTLAKWNHINSQTEKYLHEMIEIDPFDSTGYSELGFFYVKTAQHEKAAEPFFKAMILGSPGIGMNAYYYAKSLEKIGKEKESIQYLYKSAELDRNALSPWLELLTHYSDKKDSAKVKEIAKHIYEAPILMEQLEKNEIENIQNILN